MRHRSLDQVLLLPRLKGLVAGMFRLDILAPDGIADDAPLTCGALDLDSFDLLELAIGVEEEFGIAIRSGEESRIAFASIASLARFICVKTQPGGAPRSSAAPDSAGRTVTGISGGPFGQRFIA
ncbi:MAG TPA: phosphopantetheine-binding protein [Opitutaceae bacterium]|nr:phosphopantetheine-binding protein [Opitutaceae bacterium]